LEKSHGLARRGHDTQVSPGGLQHETRVGDVEHLDAPVGEHGEDLHHVEVSNEVVSQLNERAYQGPFSGHAASSPRSLAQSWARRSLRETTSAATSVNGRPVANACARRRTSASAMLTLRCTDTMPAAWCTTYWKLASVSSAVASWPGGAPACRTSTASAATSATANASACCSSLSAPARAEQRLRAPRRAAPNRSGKPNTARAPTSSAPRENASQRGVAGLARSG